MAELLKESERSIKRAIRDLERVTGRCSQRRAFLEPRRTAADLARTRSGTCQFGEEGEADAEGHQGQRAKGSDGESLLPSPKLGNSGDNARDGSFPFLQPAARHIAKDVVRTRNQVTPYTLWQQLPRHTPSSPLHPTHILRALFSPHRCRFGHR